MADIDRAVMAEVVADVGHGLVGEDSVVVIGNRHAAGMQEAAGTTVQAIDRIRGTVADLSQIAAAIATAVQAA